ncbi:MAG: ATP-binding cassette domain-containing protein [Pricia sp.]
MPSKEHWAVFINNTSDKSHFIDMILRGNLPEYFMTLQDKKGAIFSPLALEQFMDEENRHGHRILTVATGQSLQSMSSGERKKALLRHILKSDPDYMILDNPFDNLDRDTQEELKVKLQSVSQKITLIQLSSRKSDLLPFIDRFLELDGKELVAVKYGETVGGDHKTGKFKGEIPPSSKPVDFEGNILIELINVNVFYGNKPILKNINWTIRKGEFWELRGKNGSGKTTILSMITGENPKGYGQELYIFGRKKGSGESIWDIKKNIGYFTPSMTDRFSGYHSVESMIVSGLNDSIGLYVKPTEVQLRLAKQWLQLIGLADAKDRLFQDLSMGQKRLVMCARAMVKHPPLLILDEPTAGLDDVSAVLFVDLVNAFAQESDTTIIFVSHRKEPGLEPQSIYELKLTPKGSTGRVLE